MDDLPHMCEVAIAATPVPYDTSTSGARNRHIRRNVHSALNYERPIDLRLEGSGCTNRTSSAAGSGGSRRWLTGGLVVSRGGGRSCQALEQCNDRGVVSVPGEL